MLWHLSKIVVLVYNEIAASNQFQQNRDDRSPVTSRHQLRGDVVHPAVRRPCQTNQDKGGGQRPITGQGDEGTHGASFFQKNGNVYLPLAHSESDPSIALP